MEQKTDLSREFGLLPDRSGQEFGSDPAAMDPKTDFSPEFARPPDAEFGSTDSDREFARHSHGTGASKNTARRNRHRRTLLLQMAAVGLSAVVVTSSFGQDILGDDLLFTDTDHSSGSYGRQIVVEEIDEASKHDDDDSLLATSYLIYEDGSSDPGPYADSVRYDEHNNTLYLGAGPLDILSIHNMGEDFTIYLEDTCCVGLIECFGGSLTITGNPGTSLLVNQHDEYVSWWHGIILYGEGSNAYLTVSPGITVDAYGSDSAIAIDNTATSSGIRFNESYTSVSGFVQRGAYGFQDGSFVNSGATDWTIVDENGNMAEHVTFSSGAYNPGSDPPEPSVSIPPSQPVDPGTSGVSRLSITTTDQTVYQLWSDGKGWDPAPSVASYDPDTNTLTIGGTPLEVITADFMGDDFTIHVPQDTSVGTISSAGCSITLSGENTRLLVNDGTVHTYGIYIDAFGGNCWLQIDPGLTVESLGLKAGIAVANSWAAPGLVYDSTLTYMYEPVMTGDYGFPSREPNSDSTQDTTVIDEKDPFRGPSTHVYIEGSYIDPEPEPPAEESPLNRYGDLYITLPDSTDRIFIVENGQLTGNEQQIDGLSYDIGTNRLTLSDYVGDIISANVMGDDFTIYLQGENRVGQICSDGSLHFMGDTYASLSVNDGSVYAHGIEIRAAGSDAVLSAAWGPDISVFGSVAAAAVYDTIAPAGISPGTNVLLSGSAVWGSLSGDGFDPQTGIRSWTVCDSADPAVPGRYVTISSDHEGGPSSDALLTVTVDSVSTVLFADRLPTADAASLPGISYDHVTNTLILTEASFDRIEAYHMGSEFTIDLSGENYGQSILSVGSSNSADGSLRISGDHFDDGKLYGGLFLSSEADPCGILVEANGGSSALKIDWVDTLSITAAESAIMVRGSTAETGIVVDEYMETGRVAQHTADTGSWVMADYNTGEQLTEVSFYGGYGGGFSNVEHNGIFAFEPPSTNARRWIYANTFSPIYVDDPSYDYSEAIEGAAYDEATNTLTLTNCTAKSLEAVLMGDDFVIHLVGDNHLGELLLNACSVTFTGSGTLSVNEDQTVYRGFLLDAQNRSHFIQVDDGVTLRLYGSVLIHATTAEQPLILSPAVSASGRLFKTYAQPCPYGVNAEFDAGAANYTFITATQSGDAFAQFISSPYTEITGN